MTLDKNILQTLEQLRLKYNGSLPDVLREARVLIPDNSKRPSLMEISEYLTTKKFEDKTYYYQRDRPFSAGSVQKTVGRRPSKKYAWC